MSPAACTEEYVDVRELFMLMRLKRRDVVVLRLPATVSDLLIMRHWLFKPMGWNCLLQVRDARAWTCEHDGIWDRDAFRYIAMPVCEWA